MSSVTPNVYTLKNIAYLEKSGNQYMNKACLEKAMNSLRQSTVNFIKL